MGRLPLSSPSRQLPGSFLAASGRFSRAWRGPGGRATREGARRSSNLRGPVKQACKTLAFGGEGGLPGCITAEEIENPVARFPSFPSFAFRTPHARSARRTLFSAGPGIPRTTTHNTRAAPRYSTYLANHMLPSRRRELRRLDSAPNSINVRHHMRALPTRV